MKLIYLIPPLLCMQLLNGCALMNKQTKPVQPEINATTVQPAQANEDLLDYIARFTDLSADAQKKSWLRYYRHLGKIKQILVCAVKQPSCMRFQPVRSKIMPRRKVCLMI